MVTLADPLQIMFAYIVPQTNLSMLRPQMDSFAATKLDRSNSA